MHYLFLLLLLGGCASIDVELVKRIAKEKKLTLIEVDKDTSIVLRRDKDCHCAMIRYEFKF